MTMQGMKAPLRRAQPGFTLIEILMVVTIIAILCMIVVLRVRFVTLQAREDQLRENLRRMRLAVAEFQSDVGGNPTSLEQIILPKEDAPGEIPNIDANGNPLSSGSYNGPYLVPQRLPKDPFTDDGAFGYDPEEASVYSLSEKTALNGTPYSDW